MNLFKLCMIHGCVVEIINRDNGDAVFIFTKKPTLIYRYTINYIDRVENSMDILEIRMCELVDKYFTDSYFKTNVKGDA